jgi:hypothetical protein
MWPFKRKKLQKEIIDLYHMFDKRREAARDSCEKNQFYTGILFESTAICSQLLVLAHNNGFHVGKRD